MRIPGVKTARSAMRRLIDRQRAGALILGYHRIAPCDSDPFGLCVSPEHFEQQLSVLRKKAAPMPLSEVSGGIRSGGFPARAVALTFDDGYVDGLSNALPALRRQRIPATFFIVAGNRGGLFWWDELYLLIEACDGGTPVFVVGRSDAFRRDQNPAKGGIPHYGRLKATYRSMLRLAREERDAILNRYRENVDIDPGDAEGTRSMTGGELIELAGDPLVEIGSHSMTHPNLIQLSQDERKREIEDSVTALKTLLKREIVFFSYPNGAYDASLEPLLVGAGIHTACSSRPGIAAAGENLLCLPRHWVPDLEGVAFERWLLARMPRGNS